MSAGLGDSVEAYLTGRWLTDMANFSAFVFHSMPDLNWAGFYLDSGDRLILGPFVGKPACTEIAYAKGVCGAAFTSRRALRVEDVHEFPGHIACDSASRSEMVIPLELNGACFGVFDLDSPEVGRFSASDEEKVKKWLASLLEASPSLSALPWRG